MFLVHVELTHDIIRISDRNVIWARDLYHSTALVEAVKSFVPSNVKGCGEVPYQKSWLKSMAQAHDCVYTRVQHSVHNIISAMRGANST